MRKRALIIGTSHYSDSRLPQLSSALLDARGLEEVLAASEIGGFSVEVCANLTCDLLRHRIADFFAEGARDDLLLFYLTGHGLKDRGGRLYFAAADTNQERLLNTAVASSYINDAANEGRSRRVVMIFDACFSGAFARDWEIKAGSQAHMQEYFCSSTGIFLITASDALQYAHARAGQPSLFSKHLIEGLRTGKADINGDGDIGVEELYQYVAAEVRRETNDQEPKRWVFGVNGDLVVAANPAPPPGKLPEDVQSAMKSSLASVRQAAVAELERLLRAPSRPIVAAAREALHWLHENDNRVVSEAAGAALARASAPQVFPAPPVLSAAVKDAGYREAGKRLERARQEQARHAQGTEKAAIDGILGPDKDAAIVPGSDECSRRVMEKEDWLLVENVTDASQQLGKLGDAPPTDCDFGRNDLNDAASRPGDVLAEDHGKSTMREVGTKLDLARAYIDMGDPESALNILGEVLHEGSLEQRQEAQRLLDLLPGSRRSRS